MTDERIAAKIRSLLAKADSTDHEGERAECLRLADKLMLKHAIDRAEAMAASNASMGLADPIEKVEWGSLWATEHKPYQAYIDSMLNSVIKFARCRLAHGYKSNFIVGHKSDILYAELLWNNIFREFVRHINPEWNKQFDFDRNCKILRDAGYRWDVVCARAVRAGYSVRNQSCLDAYRRECRRIGVEPIKRMNSHESYRDSFADGFATRINRRIRDIEAKREQEMSDRDKELNLPLLHKDAFDVDEAFYQYFPHLRPLSKEKLEKMRQDYREYWDSLSDAEKAKVERQNRAASIRYERSKAARNNLEGLLNGQNAANTVDISMGNSGIQSDKKYLDK